MRLRFSWMQSNSGNIYSSSSFPNLYKGKWWTLSQHFHHFCTGEVICFLSWLTPQRVLAWTKSLTSHSVKWGVTWLKRWISQGCRKHLAAVWKENRTHSAAAIICILHHCTSVCLSAWLFSFLSASSQLYAPDKITHRHTLQQAKIHVWHFLDCLNLPASKFLNKRTHS